MFARDGRLMAVRFDRESLTVTGAPIPVLDEVGHAVNSPYSGAETGAANFGFSANGLLAYLPGSVQPEYETPVVWVDPDGNEEVIPVPPALYVAARLSPDGRTLLLTNGYKPCNAWLYDLERGTMRRLTFEGNQQFAVWGPGPG